MAATYLSSTNNDFWILEDFLQSGEFGILPAELEHLEHQNIQIMEQVMASLIHEMPHVASRKIADDLVSQLSIEIPTKYDSPLVYNLLTSLINQIKDAASSIGLDVSTFPNYSSIPTKQVNACAVRLPGATK